LYSISPFSATGTPSEPAAAALVPPGACLNQIHPLRYVSHMANLKLDIDIFDNALVKIN
jgi:hypothetical protein